MCGIAGFIGSDGSSEELKSLARRMANAIRHRGPDDEGVWVDAEAGVGLSHRRLSIIDLSAAGHQPMASRSGRYVMIFNGEIYNFEELRREAAAFGVSQWRGHSDTEVVLACLEQWGVRPTLQRLNGMFAIALWDREERVLTLARDRMGEKPLFYAQFSRTVLFGSELKALKIHPAFRGEIDRNVLPLYFRHNCIPAPYSIYQGVKKLPPASYIQFKADGKPAEAVAYWSAREAVENGARDPFKGSEKEAVAELDRLLRDAVGLRMVADVPLGSFLSGGIDSSTITALMQVQKNSPVRTYSIGFSDEAYNEANDARRVAQHLGTNHTELFLDPKTALDVIPELPSIYDEPFSDSSQIPTCVLARLTRQHVTVALSGDGGDEIFGGYNRHLWVKKITGSHRWLPGGARRAAGSMIRSVSPAGWDRVGSMVNAAIPREKRHKGIGDKLHKLAAALDASNASGIYERFTSHWTPADGLFVGSGEAESLLTNPAAWPASRDFAEQMMFMDSVTYLPDDILVKVDRATMATALESRVPFLDHRVVEFSWRLPLSMKIKGNIGKSILREVLYQYVPKELVDRPKAGFGVPIYEWLRGPLRGWAEELLSEKRIREQGFLDPAPVTRKWREHLSGKFNWHYHLWDVLMWQAWLEAESTERVSLASVVAES